MAPPPLHCPRCGRPAEGFEGCRSCASEGIGVNTPPPLADLTSHHLAVYPGGPWGWPGTLPTTGPPVTLGEGNTPNIRLRRELPGTQPSVGAGELWLNRGSSAERNAAMAQSVAERGWYPLTSYSSPSPGGNPYANEGYKSVAYELARDFAGRAIGAVVVPTSRADLLAGIGRGFRELAAAGLVAQMPRLVAAEPARSAPFTAALRCADRADQELTRVTDRPSVAFSLGEERPCWQGLDALWRSHGTAVAVTDDAIMAECRRLAAEGLIMEPSSAVAVAVARGPAVAPGELVVAVGTATGLKGLVS